MCNGEVEFPITLGCVSLITHHMLMCVWVDVIGGNTWLINRVDQNAMGNFNSPSHVGWSASEQVCDGNFNSISHWDVFC
jgi:hypothetical protein